MKDKIIIWTPDLPEGYGACDQCEDDYIDESLIEEDYEEETE